MSDTPCLDEIVAILAAQSARRTERGRELRSIDGGIAGAALALVQKADEECPRLHRDEAADLWAMGVYANRVLRRWADLGDGRPRRSLRWLRERAT